MATEGEPSDFELALNILESDDAGAAAAVGSSLRNKIHDDEPDEVASSKKVTKKPTISSSSRSVTAATRPAASSNSSDDGQMKIPASNKMVARTKDVPGAVEPKNVTSAKLGAKKTLNETLESSDPSAPIILSHAGWASSHPGLLKLVEEFKSLFEEEWDDRVDPKKSIAVNRVIQKLVKEYAPKILLETTDEAAPLKHTQISYGDILIGGAYHSMMAKKVKECFERQSLETDEVFGADSPPPKALPVSQSPDDSFVNNSVTAGVKRFLPARTKDGGASSKKPSLLTPVRAGAQHDPSAEKTPIAGNKKASLRDVVLPRSASRAASRQAKRLMQEIPTANRRYVRVDQLTYDWSSLRIDGAAAWNRFLQEKSDPCVELQPPVVTAMDTYQLVQSLKSGLATTTPPPGSYLYDALSDNFDPEENPEAPKTRLMTLFRDMADYETGETSKHKHSYHLMKAQEIRDHLIEMEKDVAKLNAIGAQLDDEASVVAGPTRIRKDRALKPVFWQEDFATLCENKNGATRYLMPQDQY